MKKLAFSTYLLILCASPAVQAAPERPSNEAFEFSFLPIPLPLVALGAQMDAKNLNILGQRSDLDVLAGYFWSRNYIFDPSSTTPRPPNGVSGDVMPMDNWRISSEWDFHPLRDWKLGPTILIHGGGPKNTGAYDSDLAGAFSGQIGIALRLRAINEPGFPTSGESFDATASYGRYFGATSLDFQKAGINLVHFQPIAKNQTLAFRGTLQMGSPMLPWLDKYSVGGGDFVRGFQWNRFTGDRIEAVGIEYRNLFIENLPGLFGFPTLLPMLPGVAFTTFVDAGRGWESRANVGVPVGTDLRLGGGIGLVGTIDRVPLGRFELNAGPEGLVPVVELSTSY